MDGVITHDWHVCWHVSRSMSWLGKCVRLFTCKKKSFEPPRDKINKMICAPTKTQISLGICLVWSESSPCALRIAKGPMFLHADSEDSDQTGRMPRLIWTIDGRTGHFVDFVMLRLIWYGGQNTPKKAPPLNSMVLQCTYVSKRFRRNGKQNA